MRGGPSPSVVKPRPSWKFGAEGPTERGPHVPSRAVEGYRPSFKNSSWAPSWLQVRIFSLFVCVFFARCLEVAFFTVSPWFWNGFWEVWGGFWGCSDDFLSRDFQKKSILKKLAFPLERIDKFKGSSHEKSMNAS